MKIQTGKDTKVMKVIISKEGTKEGNGAEERYKVP